jgi:hypothetical protein
MNNTNILFLNNNQFILFNKLIYLNIYTNIKEQRVKRQNEDYY